MKLLNTGSLFPRIKTTYDYTYTNEWKTVRITKYTLLEGDNLKRVSLSVELITHMSQLLHCESSADST